MARTLEQLQKQYNSAAASAKSARGPGMHGPGGPGGHGPRGGGMGGKPKDTKKTMRRLLGYMRPYWLRFLLVLLCMLVSTATSLLGSYLLAPVIDKLTLAVKPDAMIKMSAIEQAADRVIAALTATLSLPGGEVMAYLITAVALLCAIYLVGIATTYLQGRLMLSVSQGIIERIRNELFTRLQSLPVR